MKYEIVDTPETTPINFVDRVTEKANFFVLFISNQVFTTVSIHCY